MGVSQVTRGASSSRAVTFRGWLCTVLLALPTGGAPLQSDPIEITTHARALQPGEVVRLDVRAREPLKAVSIKAFGHAIQAFRNDDGVWRALVGIDLDVAAGEAPVAITARTAAGGEIASRTSWTAESTCPGRWEKNGAVAARPSTEPST